MRSDPRKDLAAWTARAAKAGAAIGHLTAEPALLRLKAQGRAGALSGKSDAVAATVDAAADELWSLYLLLDKTLEEARELVDSANPFGAEARAEKADALLNGASIHLPEAAASLATLSLSGGDRRQVTPDELLDLMDTKFTELRDQVSAAQRGWALEETLIDRGRQIAALDAEIEALGCGRPGAIEEAEIAMEEARARIEADPLEAGWMDGKVQALLAKAERALALPRREAREAESLVIKAGASLAALDDLLREAAAARETRLLKIADPLPDKPVPQNAAEQLRSWLESLRQAAAARRTHAALIGFAKWTEAAEAAEREAKAALDSDTQILAALERLRGRCSALAVKLQARGDVPPDAAESLAQARSLLETAAASLPEATRLLRRCETVAAGQT